MPPTLLPVPARRWSLPTDTVPSPKLVAGDKLAIGTPGASAQAVIDRLRSDPALMASLRYVPNTTVEEQASGTRSNTQAIEAEYNGGDALPDDIKALRHQLLDDPAGLNQLDGVIFEVIRQQHSDRPAFEVGAEGFGPPANNAASPSPIARSSFIATDTDWMDAVEDGARRPPAAVPRANADGTYSIDIDIEFPPRAATSPVDAAGSSPTPLDNVVKAAASAGAALLSDLTGTQFTTYPRSADSLGVGYQALTPEQKQQFADSLSRGGLLARTYESNLEREFNKRGGVTPTTQAEFDDIQNVAWLATLKDPAVNDGLARIQLANNDAPIAARIQSDIDSMEESFRYIGYPSALKEDVALAGGSDARTTLHDCLKRSASPIYERYRSGIASTYGEDVAKRFDAALLEHIQGQLRLRAELKLLLPDLSSLTHVPNGETRNGDGPIVWESRQTGSDTEALLQSLEGKDASELLRIRQDVYDKRGKKAGEVFDTVALDALRDLPNDKEGFFFSTRDLYIHGGPQPTEVQQDAIGDCYFVASLASFARAQPDVIRNAISYDENTHVFRVKCYSVDGEERDIEVTQQEIRDNIFGKVDYTRTSDGPIQPSEDNTVSGASRLDNNYPTNDGSIWPAVLEIAFAKSRDTNPSDGLKEGYTAIGNGGTGFDTLYFLTGQSTRYDLTTPDAFYARSDILERFRLGDGVYLGTGASTDAELPKLEELGLLKKHAYSVTQAWQDKDGELYLELLNPLAPNKRIVVSIKDIQNLKITIQFASRLEASTEKSIGDFVSRLPAGVYSKHRAAGDGQKSIDMSIKQHSKNGIVDYAAVLDDVYTEPGAVRCNLLPAQLRQKIGELQSRIDGGDKQAWAELQFLGSEVVKKAQNDYQTYLDKKNIEIGKLDLSKIPAEFIQAAKDYAAQNPGADPVAVITRIFTDEAGNPRTSNDPAVNAQLDALRSMYYTALAECGLSNMTNIGRDSLHPNGNLEQGYLAWNLVAGSLLGKMGVN